MRPGMLGRVMVLAAIAVIVAAGLCLLDGDEAGGQDLCAPSLMVTVALLLGFPLGSAGHYLPALVRIRPLYPDLPAPPPKA